MQPIQIVVISPLPANPPAWETLEAATARLTGLLFFCLLCVTSGFGAFVVLGTLSSLAANLAALACVTVALGSVLGYAAQEVGEQWQGT